MTDKPTKEAVEKVRALLTARDVTMAHPDYDLETIEESDVTFADLRETLTALQKADEDRDEWKEAYFRRNKDADDFQARATKLEADLGRAREALKPFSKAWSKAKVDWPPTRGDLLPWYAPEDFRQAHDLYTSLGGDEGSSSETRLQKPTVSELQTQHSAGKED